MSASVTESRREREESGLSAIERYQAPQSNTAFVCRMFAGERGDGALRTGGDGRTGVVLGTEVVVDDDQSSASAATAAPARPWKLQPWVMRTSPTCTVACSPGSALAADNALTPLAGDRVVASSGRRSAVDRGRDRAPGQRPQP